MLVEEPEGMKRGTSRLKTEKELARCSLKEAGISSGAVAECLDYWKRQALPIHSFLIARHQKLALELYCESTGGRKLHRLYSLTKSLTSLAVGCLEAEGRIHLDDPIVDYFPEYTPVHVSEWLGKTTIRHMLQMTSCYSTTTYKQDLRKNWVESFFTAEADHAPGTIFSYDTSASHTLCALTEKLTGMSMLDYLRQKCLDEIGFSRDAYVLKDPFGTSMGGTGLMARPTDMIKLGILLLNHGSWEGKQLLPGKYLEKALSPQIPSCVRAQTISQAQGYGYQFWCLKDGIYGCWGKGGQRIVCVPDKELIFVTTADTEGILAGDQRVLDGIFDYILPAAEGNVKGDENAAFLPLRLKTVWEEAGGSKYSPKAAVISGVLWKIKSPGWLQGVSVTFTEDGSEGNWIYRCSSKSHNIHFGMKCLKQGMMEQYNQPYCASGSWLTGNTLYIKIYMLGEEPCQIRIQMVFGQECSMYLFNTGEMWYREFSGWHCGVPDK